MYRCEASTNMRHYKAKKRHQGRVLIRKIFLLVLLLLAQLYFFAAVDLASLRQYQEILVKMLVVSYV
jgi:hypothetical protein